MHSAKGNYFPSLRVLGAGGGGVRDVKATDLDLCGAAKLFAKADGFSCANRTCVCVDWCVVGGGCSIFLGMDAFT